MIQTSGNVLYVLTIDQATLDVALAALDIRADYHWRAFTASQLQKRGQTAEAERALALRDQQAAKKIHEAMATAKATGNTLPIEP